MSRIFRNNSHGEVALYFLKYIIFSKVLSMLIERMFLKHSGKVQIQQGSNMNDMNSATKPTNLSYL